LDEGTRPRSGKLRLNLHGTILERKTIALSQKKSGAKKKHVGMFCGEILLLISLL
jgi:hypothetical protein